MEWLTSSIGGYMQGGNLPSVPEERRLEQALYVPRRHPRLTALTMEFLNRSAWARDLLLQRRPVNDISSLAAYVWPNSPDDTRAITLVKLMQWIFLLDDAVDDVHCPQADKLCHRLLHHMFPSGPFPPALQEGLHIEREPLLIFVGLEWWKEVQASSAPKQQARFAAALKQYLHYQAAFPRVREKFQQAEIPPGLQEYTVLRRFSSGLHVCVVMVEYDLGIELDEEFCKSPILQQLLEVVEDHTACLNDILSFPKEFASGDMLNLLPLLHLRNNEGRGDKPEVPFPVAVSQAWQILQEQEQEVARLAQQLRRSLKMTPGLEKYLETICDMACSTWEWTLQSPRYKVNHLAPPTSTGTTMAYHRQPSSPSSGFSRFKSPPLSPLAFSPFKSPSKGLKNLTCAPKRGRNPPLFSRGAKGSFSFPHTSSLRQFVL